MIATQLSGVGYLRVSTDRQEDGVRAQLKIILQSAERLGIEPGASAEELDRAIEHRITKIGEVYLDFGASGFKQARRGYIEFMARVRSDEAITHVFVPARDRLGRRQAECGYFG